MDSRRLLERICRRHGLSYTDAARLLPLLNRAIRSPASVRDRLLTLVERNLARRSPLGSDQRPDAVFLDLDEEVLSSVAKVVHNWSPSDKLLDVSRLLPDLFPQDPQDEG